jgi:hypothetical protein
MQPADFYVRLSKSIEWLGSISSNGGVLETICPEITFVTSAHEFRSEIRRIAKRDDFHSPEEGWPWKWKTSASTDFCYVFTKDQVEVYKFGRKRSFTEDDTAVYSSRKDTWFPDMSSAKSTVSLSGTSTPKLEYLELSAEVRYWGDATVNETIDKEGTLIPLRTGKCWTPTIRLKDGQVMEWPYGVTAEIYYKVCDQGEYWLRDSEHRLFKYRGDYVPDEYLCKGDAGFGDYIILSIDKAGKVRNWWRPKFKANEWEAV